MDIGTFARRKALRSVNLSLLYMEYLHRLGFYAVSLTISCTYRFFLHPFFRTNYKQIFCGSWKTLSSTPALLQIIYFLLITSLTSVKTITPNVTPQSVLFSRQQFHGMYVSLLRKELDLILVVWNGYAIYRLLRQEQIYSTLSVRCNGWGQASRNFLQLFAPSWCCCKPFIKGPANGPEGQQDNCV